jgi:hypothetical protein
VLITLHDPSRASLSISSFLPGSQPDFMRQDHHAVSDGEPLPADWSQRTRTRIGEVVEDADESEAMRFAARRALFYLQRQRGVSRPACESEGGCRDGPDRAHLRGVDRSGARGGYIPDPYRDRLPQPTAERGDGRAIDCIPRYNHGRLALSEAIRTRLHRGHDDIGIAADGATGVRSSVRPTPISASRWGPRASRVWWVANTR